MAAAVTTHEQAARLAKAIRLADLLDGAGIRPTRAALMNAEEWRMLAAAAQTHPPSNETRTLALSLLVARRQARSALAGLRRRGRTPKF